jgi:hypothetical protein
MNGVPSLVSEWSYDGAHQRRAELSELVPLISGIISCSVCKSKKAVYQGVRKQQDNTH